MNEFGWIAAGLLAVGVVVLVVLLLRTRATLRQDAAVMREAAQEAAAALVGGTGAGKVALAADRRIGVAEQRQRAGGGRRQAGTAAGIELDESLSPAEKLKVVQKLMEQEDSRAANIYRSIGTYLGHSLALYHSFYGFKHILLLGRVMSGKGGDIVLEVCKEVLKDEYPEIAGKINPTLPDEKARRVGQSVAAASLPKLS